MKKKLVFAAVKGPPYGGMPTVTAMFLKSDLFKKNDALFVDTTPIEGKYGPIQIFRILHSCRLFWRLIAAVIKHRAQVVYIMSPSLLGFYEKGLMCLVCKILGARTVIHLLGGGFKSFYEKSFLNGMLVRFLLRRCDAVATVSQYWKDFLATIVTRERVWIIPNPVESKKFYNEDDKEQEDGKVTILFAGYITAYKGIRDLLEAVRRYRASFEKTKFIIIGKGDLLEECQNRALEQQLTDIVSFLGYVSEEDKIRFFKTSDIFVLPSHVDALPVAALEAMSAGMPVVATKVGGVPSIVQDGKTGFLLSPGDVEMLAQRMRQLVEDRDLRDEMGKRAQRFVSENFDIELVADRLDALLEAVAYGKTE